MDSIQSATQAAHDALPQIHETKEPSLAQAGWLLATYDHFYEVALMQASAWRSRANHVAEPGREQAWNNYAGELEAMLAVLRHRIENPIGTLIAHDKLVAARLAAKGLAGGRPFDSFALLEGIASGAIAQTGDAVYNHGIAALGVFLEGFEDADRVMEWIASSTGL